MARATDMTTGNPTGLLLRFAFPLILTNIGQQLYSIVDAIIVGRGVGVEALASLGATDWLYWLILWAVQAMTQGFGVLISQTFGSGNRQDFRRAVAMSILLSGSIGLILTLCSMALAQPMLLLLHTPENIFPGARLYLMMMYGGTLITMAYNMSAACLRAVGDGRTPLMAMGIAGVCNIVLDLVFVMGFHWGIAGAAAASLLSQLLSFLYCMRVIRRFDLFTLEKADWTPNRAVLTRLCRLGIPLALAQMIVVVGGIVAQSVINTYGYVVLAGFTATNKLHGLLDCSATALGAATSTFIGQNWGANRLDRVKLGLRRAVIIGVCIAVSIMVVMIRFGRPIVGLFISADAADAALVLDTAYQYLFIMSCFLIAAYIMNVYRFALQGLGDSLAPMFSGVFECAARSGAALLLPALIGQAGLFSMDGCAWAAAGIFQLICFYMDLHRIEKNGLRYQAAK